MIKIEALWTWGNNPFMFISGYLLKVKFIKNHFQAHAVSWRCYDIEKYYKSLTWKALVSKKENNETRFCNVFLILWLKCCKPSTKVWTRLNFVWNLSQYQQTTMKHLLIPGIKDVNSSNVNRRTYVTRETYIRINTALQL